MTIHTANSVWHWVTNTATTIKQAVWDTFCVDWVWRTFAVKWVWNTFAVDWVAKTFAVKWIWNGVLKPASQNPIVNGIIAVGGLVITVAGAIVTSPFWGTVLLVSGIVVGAIGVILWFRSLFE